MKLKVYEFTVREDSPTYEPGYENLRYETYTFKGYVLPTGEVLVPYESTNDGFFDNLDSVEACGTDTIENYTDTGKVIKFTAKEIRNSVKGSADEFGVQAIPESLKRYLA